jgi:hypothetical protein
MTAGQVPGEAAGMGWPTAPAHGRNVTSIAIRDRIGAATGAAFVALILVGNQMASGGPAESAHPTGEEVLRDVAHQASSATFTAGFVAAATGLHRAALVGRPTAYIGLALGAAGGRTAEPRVTVSA